MLLIIAVVLALMWGMGFFFMHVGFQIHAVLALAVILAAVALIQGRRGG